MEITRLLNSAGGLDATIHREENGDARIFNRHEVILGNFNAAENATYNKDGERIAEGDFLTSMIGHGYHYVYALIDPENNNQPFYIGKGFSNRIMAHFNDAAEVRNFSEGLQLKEGQERIGLPADEILQTEVNITENQATKIAKINELIEHGHTPQNLARVVCRRVNEETALAVEAFLIQGHYGLNNLKNVVQGHHPDRFRPVNNWDYMPGFDLGVTGNGDFVSDSGHRFGDYYVYVLRDPVSHEVFYVGKGKGNRIRSHFEDARNNIEPQTTDKLVKIQQLLNAGHKPSDIGRVIARVSDESLAFMLESLCIRFVFGYDLLTNVATGNNNYLFRSKGDWEPRHGFDLPTIIEPGVRQSRRELLDSFLGQGLDLLLYEARDLLVANGNPHQLNFCAPFLEGAGELTINAPLTLPDTSINEDHTVLLRISVRNSRDLFTEIWPTTYPKPHERIIPINAHFSKLTNNAVLRRDRRFNPSLTLGKPTTNINELVTRAKKLIRLVKTPSRDQLDNELREVLNFEYVDGKQMRVN